MRPVAYQPLSIDAALSPNNAAAARASRNCDECAGVIALYVPDCTRSPSGPLSFTAYVGKHLPTDVTRKLAQLRACETNLLANAIYDSMAENQEAANRLDRPCCQDTGVIQYFITAGARFPYLGDLEEALRDATLEATRTAPLRHNAVETFDEKNTGTNTGYRVPWLDWEITPNADNVAIDVHRCRRFHRLLGTSPRVDSHRFGSFFRDPFA